MSALHHILDPIAPSTTNAVIPNSRVPSPSPSAAAPAAAAAADSRVSVTNLLSPAASPAPSSRRRPQRTTSSPAPNNHTAVGSGGARLDTAAAATADAHASNAAMNVDAELSVSAPLTPPPPIVDEVVVVPSSSSSSRIVDTSMREVTRGDDDDDDGETAAAERPGSRQQRKSKGAAKLGIRAEVAQEAAARGSAAQGATAEEEHDDDEEEDADFEGRQGDEDEDEDEEGDEDGDDDEEEEEDDDDDEDDEDEDEDDDEDDDGEDEEDEEEGDEDEREDADSGDSATKGKKRKKRVRLDAAATDGGGGVEANGKRSGKRAIDSVDGAAEDTDNDAGAAGGQGGDGSAQGSRGYVGAKGRDGEAGHASSSKTADGGGGGGAVAATKPKKKPRRIKRSPVAPVLPTGPPQRPTVVIELSMMKPAKVMLDKKLGAKSAAAAREAAAVAAASTANDDEGATHYMLNVPEVMVSMLKGKDDAWAAWYEAEMLGGGAGVDGAATTSGVTSRGGGDAAGGSSMPTGPDGQPLNPAEFGEFAHLVAKYANPTQLGAAPGALKKRRKKRFKDNEYDVNDDFVDDSELIVDEPTHSAKPSAEGFFVSEGPVELARLHKARRRKGVRGLTAAAAAAAAANGTSAGSLSGVASVDGNAAVLTPEQQAAVILGGLSFGASLAGGDASAVGYGNSQGAKSTTTGSSAVANRLIAKRARERGTSVQMPAGYDMSEAEIREAEEASRKQGTKSTPITLEDEQPVQRQPDGSASAEGADSAVDVEAASKRDSAQPPSEAKPAPRRKLRPVLMRASKHVIADPHPLLLAYFGWLQDEAKQHFKDWSPKQKFPPPLKPPLVQAAKLALELGEYNDNFFNWLPTLFPYNRFTLMKFTKREFFEEHMKVYRTMQSEYLEELRQLVGDSEEAQTRDYERALRIWQARQDREGAPDDEENEGEGERGAGEEAKGEDEGGYDQDDAAERDDDDADGGAATSGKKGGGGGGAGTGGNSTAPGARPVKKWRWNEDMRDKLAGVVVMESAMVEVKNEKLELEKSVDKVSDINSRKALYKRIHDVWTDPEWVTSTAISREFSLLKRKYDRITERAAAATATTAGASALSREASVAMA